MNYIRNKCFAKIIRMEERVLIALSELKEALKEHPLVKELKQREQKMIEDDEFWNLKKKKEEAENQYYEAREHHLNEDEAIKSLQIATKNFKNYDLVKEYEDIYRKVSDVYHQLDKMIIGPYRL